MQKLKFINSLGEELDFTDGINYGVVEWNGLSEVDLNVQSQQVPFKDGAVYIDSLYSQRELSFTVAMNDEKSLTKRYTLKREVISKMNSKLGEGYLYYSNDVLEKRIKVIAQAPIFPTKNFDEAGTLKFSISFTACNPYWEDNFISSATIFNGDNIIDMQGDVSSDVIIDIKNVNTDGGTSISINNETTKKSIIFDNITDNIRINLTNGQKSVNKIEQFTKDIEIDWNSLPQILEFKRLNEDAIVGMTDLNTWYCVKGQQVILINETEDYTNIPCKIVIKDNTIYRFMVKNYRDFIVSKSKDGETWIDVYTQHSNNYVDFYYLSCEVMMDYIFVTDPVKKSLIKTRDFKDVKEIMTGSSYNILGIYQQQSIIVQKDLDYSLYEIKPSDYTDEIRYINTIISNFGDYRFIFGNELIGITHDSVYDTINKFNIITGITSTITTTRTNFYHYLVVNSEYVIGHYFDEILREYKSTTPTDGNSWVNTNSMGYSNVQDWVVVGVEDINITMALRNRYSRDGYFIKEQFSKITDNLISELNPNSDMDFNLVKGKNKINITSNVENLNGIIKYRNKFVGV